MVRSHPQLAALALALIGASCGRVPLDDFVDEADAGPRGGVVATGALSRIPWGPDEIVDFCGDSLVQGGIVGAAGVSVPWRTPLEADAAAAQGKPKSTFAHGYSGTQMDCWANTYRDVLGHGGTIAFVAWGVNDVLGGTDPATTTANLKAGIRAVWAVEPRKRFVVLGAMNLGELWPDGAGGDLDGKLDETNAAMKAAVDELGVSGTITWVDPRPWWYPAIEAANPANTEGRPYEFTVDGLHLNARGAEAAAAFLWSLRDPL